MTRSEKEKLKEWADTQVILHNFNKEYENFNNEIGVCGVSRFGVQLLCNIAQIAIAVDEFLSIDPKEPDVTYFFYKNVMFYQIKIGGFH